MLALGSCYAAPDPPLEGILDRAENIFIGRVTSTVPGKSATYEVVEVLRGTLTGKETLLFEDGFHVDRIGDRCLLLSQGDSRYGGPRPVIGLPLDGQEIWRGWMTIPMRVVDGREFVRWFSTVDLKPGAPFNPWTSIDEVKSLIKRFPYDSHVNDKS